MMFCFVESNKVNLLSSCFALPPPPPPLSIGTVVYILQAYAYVCVCLFEHFQIWSIIILYTIFSRRACNSHLAEVGRCPTDIPPRIINPIKILTRCSIYIYEIQTITSLRKRYVIIIFMGWDTTYY